MKVAHSTLAVVAFMALGAALVTEARAQQPPAPPRPAAPATAPVVATVPGAARVGIVDVQRVLARSAAGVGAREQLERERTAMQKEMDGRRADLEKLREELEKKGPLMTADSRREKQDTFDRKRRDAARMHDDFQKELEKKEQQLLQRVLQDLNGVIERVAKDKGLGMVLERRALLYASTDADITDEVIRAYDQDASTRGKKP